MPRLALWEAGGPTLCSWPAESLALAGSQWLIWPLLSFELQVWPKAHPVLQLPAAGGQRLRCSLQPRLSHVHGLALPVWLQHRRCYPELRDLE